MVAHSGIGVVVRALLRTWTLAPPPFDVVLLGDREALPRGITMAEAIQFDLPIYSPAALMARPPLGGADVFFCPHYAAPLRAKAPTVAMVQDLIHVTHPPKPGTGVYMRAVLAGLRRRARFVVTPSRHTKVQLQTLHGFEPHRVLTAAYGPGLGATRPSRTPTTENLPARYLLAAGIWKPHKNWPFLFERLGRMARLGKMSVPLVVAGIAPQDERACLDEARRAGAEALLLPRVSDAEMMRVYEQAECFLFPSLVEGFGLPVVEAMAAGTPVIVADLPPMNEIARGVAMMFDPDNPESFDRALAMVASERELRREMSEKGKARAAEYSWERFARELADILVRARDAA